MLSYVLLRALEKKNQIAIVCIEMANNINVILGEIWVQKYSVVKCAAGSDAYEKMQSTSNVFYLHKCTHTQKN